ncbi:MAG: hypothetical protein NC131_06425 [Roseburia sp.]|nr:hypothetical protein [Roseburia sp.]
MDVEIKPLKVRYQGKTITIDVQKELTVDRNKLESQLREVPSSYFILCSVRNYYIRKRDALARERDESYSKAWTFLKDANPSWNNDYVSNKANSNKKYVSLCNRYLKAAEKAAKLIDLCKAYESKEGILRTISANLRRQ